MVIKIKRQLIVFFYVINNFTENYQNDIISMKEGKYMAQKYLEKNVLEASLERLEIIFNNFNNIYFSIYNIW